MIDGTTSNRIVKPAYVGQNGPVYSQPFTLQHIRLHGFAIQGNLDSIQQNVCDRWFNTPSGGAEQFRAASSYVLLAYSQIQAITSQVLPYSSYGGFPELEIGFWVLMVDEKRKQLCWTSPYLFVDSPPAIAAGREIYGFPKQMGWITMPSTPADGGQYTLDALVLDEYSPQSMGHPARVLTVQHNGSAPDPSEAGDLLSMGHLMLSLFKTMEVHENLFDDLRIALNSGLQTLHGELTVVYLKQFRDCADGNLACYQSIVSAPMQARAFHSATWLPPCDITLDHFANFPIQSDLGLPDSPMRSVLSFTTDSDYEIQNGVELWKA